MALSDCSETALISRSVTSSELSTRNGPFTGESFGSAVVAAHELGQWPHKAGPCM